MLTEILASSVERFFSIFVSSSWIGIILLCTCIMGGYHLLARANLKLLCNEIDEGMIFVNRRARVRYMNRAARKMLLLGDSTRWGYPLSSYFLGQRAAQGSALMEVFLSSKQQCQRVERVFAPSKEGDERFILIAIPRKKLTGYYLVIQDASFHTHSLMVGKEFIANASHELRTPVTIIRGFAETLRDIPEIAPEMFGSILEKILRNCERMETLVKNLLRLADLDRLSDIKKDSCDLVALWDHCSQQLLSIEPDAYIEVLQNRKTMSINGNSGLLDLAFMNILHNAVKYKRERVHIRVILEQKDTEVVVCIEDQGIGIASEHIPYIFDRFYTVNKSHTRKWGGTGLGLSMVKKVLEKHEATIQVDSRPQEGTRFIIRFPFALPVPVHTRV